MIQFFLNLLHRVKLLIKVTPRIKLKLSHPNIAITHADDNRISAKIRPEIRMRFLLLQEEKYLHASLVIKIIPDANMTADSIASESPKVSSDDINNNSILPLNTLAKKSYHCAIIDFKLCTISP
jgi:hypothetical protein